MFPRLITKYGLATHLALLASLPLALVPFLSEASLSKLIFWLSGIAFVWLLAEPSMRSGEHLSLARARVIRSLLRDPFAWFMLAVVAYALIRWCNSGIQLRYDAEQGAWLVSEPAMTAAPASVGEAGCLPFAIAVGLFVLMSGIRHGIGLAARISFGVTASLVVGLGGIYATYCLVASTFLGQSSAFLDVFKAMAVAGPQEGPYWGTMYGVWFVCSLVFGAQAEARKWGVARIPLCLSVAGCACGLVLYAPPVASALYFGLGLVVALFCCGFIGRTSSMGAVARYSVLAILGISFAAFVMIGFLSSSKDKSSQAISFLTDFRLNKVERFDYSLMFSKSKEDRKSMPPEFQRVIPEKTWADMSSTLSGIAKKIWSKDYWCGAGVGSFEMHARFLADKKEWKEDLPLKPAFALNSYWTFLAERGIVGCLILAMGLVFLVFTYIQRLVQSFCFLHHNDDADVFFFACPPVVWAVPLVVALVCLEAVVSPVFSLLPTFFVVAVPLAVAAASFPRKSGALSDSSKKDN